MTMIPIIPPHRNSDPAIYKDYSSRAALVPHATAGGYREPHIKAIPENSYKKLITQMFGSFTPQVPEKVMASNSVPFKVAQTAYEEHLHRSVNMTHIPSGSSTIHPHRHS